MKEQLYRVRWTSKLTGTTGHGTGKYSHDEAKRYADFLNESVSGELCHHTVELATEEENETQRQD